jgi:hypothetical protein
LLFQVRTQNQETSFQKQGVKMKQFWIGVVGTALLCLAAGAQTASTSGSAGANASAGQGQANAGANANQSVQAPGASANAGGNAYGNAQVSGEPKTKSDEPKTKSGDSKSHHESGSQAHKNSNGGDTAATGSASALLSQGSTVNTELTKPVDCKKAKPGDEVTAKVTQDVKSDGKVVVHKGSKVVGHVTEAQAKDKEHPDSKLGIAFDKIVLKDGQEMAFNGAVQAIAPPAQVLANAAGNQSAGLDAPMGGGGGRAPSGGGRSGGGGLVGGAVSGVGSTAGAATGTVGAVGNVGGAVGGATHGATSALSAQGTLTSASRGVVGLEGVNLTSATGAAGSAQGSLITSPTRNIKLDSGTQVLLQAAGSAEAAGSVAK